MPSKAPNLFIKIIRMLERVEDGILISLLLAMIGLAVIQILLRNFFETGILWADPLIRNLVLWIGLIGAMIASRKHNHITIDIISRYLPKTAKRVSMLAVSIFTAGICAVMAFYSFNFVMMEKTDAIPAFARVPAWICESIIPFAFAVISLRYIFLFFSSLIKILSKENQ